MRSGPERDERSRGLLGRLVQDFRLLRRGEGASPGQACTKRGRGHSFCAGRELRTVAIPPLQRFCQAALLHLPSVEAAPADLPGPHQEGAEAGRYQAHVIPFPAHCLLGKCAPEQRLVENSGLTPLLQPGGVGAGCSGKVGQGGRREAAWSPRGKVPAGEKATEMAGASPASVSREPVVKGALRAPSARDERGRGARREAAETPAAWAALFSLRQRFPFARESAWSPFVCAEAHPGLLDSTHWNRE